MDIPLFAAFQIPGQNHEQRYTAHKDRPKHDCNKARKISDLRIIKPVSQVKMQPKHHKQGCDPNDISSEIVDYLKSKMAGLGLKFYRLDKGTWLGEVQYKLYFTK